MPLRCEIWADLIFVNQDPGAVSLRDWLGSLADELTELEQIGGRVAQLTSTVHGCNWKVMAEAFLETYHLNTVHPKTVGTYIDQHRTAIGLFPNGHSRMITPLHDAILERYHGRSPFPELDLPELGGLYHETDVAYGVFPNLITPLEPHGFPLLVFWPVDVATTRLDEIWIGRDWGEGERPAAWDKKLAVFDQVMQEDYRNLEPIQQSIEAAAHGGVPLNYQERRIQPLPRDDRLRDRPRSHTGRVGRVARPGRIGLRRVPLKPVACRAGVTRSAGQWCRSQPETGAGRHRPRPTIWGSTSVARTPCVLVPPH